MTEHEAEVRPDMLCPLRNMPVRKYAGLLDEIAGHCYKVFKKTA